MGGGLLQLVAYGAQDAYLTGNPHITFWKILYKRHTNFAMEAFRVNFTGAPVYGQRLVATVNRNADLIWKTYVEVTLPNTDGTSAGTDVVWSPGHYRRLGYALLQQVEVEIGGQIIDRHYGEWLYIWETLTADVDTASKLEAMVDAETSGQTTSGTSCNGRPTVLYVPLQFWFCRNPGLALPLIALQYHEVRFNITLEDAVNLVSVNPGPGSPISAAAAQLPALTDMALYLDYIYLDVEERRRFAQESHEYLIEQLQYEGQQQITTSSARLDLTLNHPVKELIWVVQRDSFVDCNAPPTPWIMEALGQQPFNYSDDWSTEGIVTAVLGRGALATNGTGGAVPTFSVSAGPGAGFLPGSATAGFAYAQSAINGLGVATNSGLTTGSGIYQTDGSAGADNFFEGTTNYLLAKVILASNVKCEGKNPVEVAKVQLNGQDRFDEREGRYFDKVQPWQHHTRTPSVGINVYSFALKPEEHQPSGTCNFSRIDKATLNLTLSVNTVQQQRTAKVRIYAVNYNVLRVMSGMGGLAYSN